jgi:cyclopropane fatty-acyl-phospholipid synthase-like methyltransferase
MAKGAAVPERIRWAVETLAVDPADHLLEVGCGAGHAVALISPKLSGGTITAIDRSALQIDLAIRNNAESISAGRATFHKLPLADAAFEPERFDKIFAINVNVFWIEPKRELSTVRRLLAPGGALYLFYEPPGPKRSGEVERKLAEKLGPNRFSVASVMRPEEPSRPMFCLVAMPSLDRPRPKGES